MSLIQDFMAVFCCIWVLCLIGTAVVIGLPFEDVGVSDNEIIKFFINEELLSWRRVILWDMRHSNWLGSCYFVAHFGHEIFLNHLKEFIVTAALYSFSPALQGIVYTMAPNWVIDGSNHVASLFNKDDSELPDLELDPQFADVTSKYEVVFDRSGRGFTGADDDNNDISTLQHGEESYIFDPVFGVVSEEIRDMWKRQQREANVRRESFMSNRYKKAALPVRYSSGDSTNISAIGDLNHLPNHIGDRDQRVGGHCNLDF